MGNVRRLKGGKEKFKKIGRKAKEENRNIRVRKKNKELCEEEEDGRVDEKAEETKTEGQVWEIVNRKRRKRRRVNFFMGLLEG